MKQSFLIIGGSGAVGSAIVRQLLSQGHRVRITTSKKPATASADGIQRVHADFVTGEGVAEAFDDIDRAFLMSPGGYADQYAILSRLIKEAKSHGLKKVVLMTAMGANAYETSPFRRAEKELETSGLAYNIIRPNWFMQNFNSFWIHGIKEQGKILLPAGDAKTSFIDTRDISDVATKLLIDDKLANRDFDLTGPQSLTHDEVADEITKGTGKRVSYQEIPPDVLKSGLVGAGLPVDYVDFLVMIFGALKAGANSAVNDNVRTIVGRAPRGFSSYVRDFKAAF